MRPPTVDFDAIEASLAERTYLEEAAAGGYRRGRADLALALGVPDEQSFLRDARYRACVELLARLLGDGFRRWDARVRQVA